MKNNEENWVTMFNTLFAFLEQNLATVNSIPAFGISYNSFVSNLTEIRHFAGTQSLKIEGFAVQKMEVKEKLSQQAAVITATVSAYANSVNDEVLRKKVDYSQDALYKMRDILLIPVIDTIIESVNTHTAALVDFGITPTLMADLQVTLVAYTDIVDDPTNAINERIDATFNLGDKIFATNELLRNQMDKHTKIFMHSNATFYRQYHLARRIIDLHGPKKDTDGTLKGIVRDSVTNFVVENAIIEILNTELILSTNALGEFSIDLAPGIYGIRVSKDDFTDLDMTDIEIVKGEEMKVTVMLEPMV